MSEVDVRRQMQPERRRTLAAALTGMILIFMLGIPAAFAKLERVGPTSAATGYPAWYQDATGLALEFGTPLNQAELDGGWTLLLPADIPSGTAPEQFPTNFAEEHFFWSGDATVDFPLPGGGTSNAILVLALEAAFAAGPVVPGDQIVFGRVRIRINDLPFDGTYKVYTPFGVWTFNDQVAGDRLFFTDDVGINAPPGDFSAALTSHIGPFLLPSNTPGGAELPSITGPVPGKRYICDPGRLGPVTGSPLPPFTSTVDGLVRNHNIFRIEGPNGFVIETYDFALTGRIFTGVIPGRVTVDRANYTHTANSHKVDVYATGLPTTQGRLPATPIPPAIQPTLSYYNAPPVVDPITGALSPPPGEPEIPMFKSGESYWAQSYPPAIPAMVTLKDANARDANGQVVPAYFQAVVTDEVKIPEALYDPNIKTLSVRASSSDEMEPTTITLVGFGNLANGQILVSPLDAPPAKVRVTSSRGGANEMQVTTLFGSPTGGNIPVAGNDAATLNEDSTATAINVLANDTLDSLPIILGPGVVLTIADPPQLGAATVNPDGTIAYTPNPNISGSDAFTYTVSVDGVVSNAATVAVTITPVNDPPVANNDTITFTVGAHTIDVLANDTDPEGQADLAQAVIVTQPQTGASVTSGSVVTFTASAPGTYTFTYVAQDQAGAQSAQPATVTVTVLPVENIVIQQATFRTTARRWIVAGTDSVPANQTLTITYANGILSNGSPASNIVIGTATVDGAGNWILDIRGVTGVLDPTNRIVFRTLPTQVRLTSPQGGTQIATITIRS